MGPTLSDCYKFVSSDPSSGAISSFVGITRNNFNGKTVLKLSYEGYISMAERVMLQLCVECKEKYTDVSKIAIVHILGDCPVGEASVIICVSSGHRRASLDSCSFLIDELKARVPIWKKEVYKEDGMEVGAVWKENIEWHEGRQLRTMVKEQKASSNT